jgi:hypothetical protein
MPKEECQNCRFYESDGDPSKDEPLGVCVRYPPPLMRAKAGSNLACFPQVDGFWWCGEWKPKAEQRCP